MFKRHVAVFSTVAAAAFALGACTSVSPSPPVQKTALWKVTSAHRILYITGDANISLKKYPVPAPITQAFAESGELVLEGDPDPDKAKLLPLMMKLGLQPSGQKLSDGLSAAQLSVVKKASSKVGVPFVSLQRFRLWLAAATVASKAIAALGIEPQQLYHHFYGEAQAGNMPVTFLDTASQELELMAGMPQKLQISFLMMTAKGALKPKQPEKRVQMIQAWRNGDTQTVAEIADKGFKGYPRLYKVVVTGRHPRWLKTLEAKLEKPGKPVFVIVGAPHLFGPGNLLDGLRNDGYRVTQL